MTSSELYARACRVIPGGVNSPARAFRSVGGQPRFIAHGHGSRMVDVEGREYIDYVGSFGPLILGHAHPEVLQAIGEVAAAGTSFGAPTELEVRLAEKIVALVPSIDKLRLVSSGTEATMSAIRLARGVTGRDKLVKIDGGYHGHADFLLVAAGSGAATLGIPGSAGVPPAAAADTLLVPYNDLAAVEQVFAAHRRQIAAIIVEPVAGNMGCVPPAEGYLAGLRRLCTETGVLLIFDEVMSGFRVALGGAQQRFAVTPDLTCLGKIIGGGLPVGAYGGAAAIMDQVAPDGPVYQAGTLSGNPVAVAAGLRTLELLERPGTYQRLEALAARLVDGIAAAARAAGVALTINRVGSMFTCFFTAGAVRDYASAKTCDTARFGRLFGGLLARGVYLPPSQFEAAFVSLAHSDEEIAATVAAFAETMGAIALATAATPRAQERKRSSS